MTSDDSRSVRTRVEQTDGKITIQTDADLRLAVSSPRTRPLSASERHATLRVVGSETTVDIELDAAALDALLDDLRKIQSGDAFEFGSG